MRRTVCSLLVLTLVPVAASAQQSYEVVGARALGMAGAFVAVANDATAVFWNPAGLVGGQAVGGTIDWGRFQFGNRDVAPFPGPSEGKSALTSFATWPVGLSYTRFESTVLIPDESGLPTAFNVRTSHFGLTLLQTIVQNLVAGTTLKYVRGRTERALVDGTTVEEALDHGSDLEGDVHNTFDMDIGFMVDMQQVRIGLTVRNLLEPTFGTVAENEITLKRRARLGLALLPANGVIIAMDLDLDTADLGGGPSRMLAIGGETRLGQRLAVRSGVRWSVTGETRLVKSVGSSFMIRPRFWLDGYFSQRETDERQYGFALRAGM